MARHILVMKDNKPAVLTKSDEVASWIFNKFSVDYTDKRSKENNVKSCVTSVLKGDGKKTKSKGSNYIYRFNGTDILHWSDGAGSNGCTLFFTVGGAGEMKIVGIGHHVGAATYEIEDNIGFWNSNQKRVSLD